MTLTFGSLFAGIGGFDLGFERAGMKCQWQVEIDDYCLKVLDKHWPNVPKYKDVRDVGKHNLETVDVICGGFPCQPHSVAGKRKGKDDDRDLWPEYRRLITELQPTWVIGENVLGIRTTILDEVLSDLESLAYSTRTLVIPACGFNAPHRRERVFVLAYSEYRRNTGWEWIERTSTNQSRNQPDDTNGSRVNVRSEVVSNPNLEQSGQDVAYANGSGLEERQAHQAKKSQASSAVESFSMGGRRPTVWDIEPDVGRVAHGVPARVDRLRTLGNAVVPQVTEWIGRRIMEVSK